MAAEVGVRGCDDAGEVGRSDAAGAGAADPVGTMP